MLSFTISSQNYVLAGGIKLGTDYGISFTTRLLPKLTVEFIDIPGFKNNESSLGILFKRHHSLITKSINFFTGAGFQNSWQTYTDDVVPVSKTAVTFTLGAEFTIKNLNVSWDYQPAFYVSNQPGSDFKAQTYITVRHVFLKKVASKKQKERRKKKRERIKIRNKKKK
jgi:hypothetical protein